MPQNVEIKARVKDPEGLAAIIYDLTDSMGAILRQEDTFFNVQNGRLKLRVSESESHGELIYYERPDSTGPKCCDYYSSYIADAETFKFSMTKALGIRGTLKKVRRLYMFGTTRIHLDEVAGLGCFLELEVVLQPGQTSEDGEKIAKELMAQLGVEETDLIAGAYVDLLLQDNLANASQENIPAPAIAATENGAAPVDQSA